MDHHQSSDLVDASGRQGAPFLPFARHEIGCVLRALFGPLHGDVRLRRDERLGWVAEVWNSPLGAWKLVCERGAQTCHIRDATGDRPARTGAGFSTEREARAAARRYKSLFG